MSEHRMQIDWTDPETDTRTGYCDCGFQTTDCETWDEAYDELVSSDHLAGVPDSLIILPEAESVLAGLPSGSTVDEFDYFVKTGSLFNSDNLVDRIDLAIDEMRETQ